MLQQMKNDRKPAVVEQPQKKNEPNRPAAGCKPDSRDDQGPQSGLRHQEHEYKKGDNGGLFRDI
jgi:hypothetical protein